MPVNTVANTSDTRKLGFHSKCLMTTALFSLPAMALFATPAVADCLDSDDTSGNVNVCDMDVSTGVNFSDDDTIHVVNDAMVSNPDGAALVTGDDSVLYVGDYYDTTANGSGPGTITTGEGSGNAVEAGNGSSIFVGDGTYTGIIRSTVGDAILFGDGGSINYLFVSGTGYVYGDVTGLGSDEYVFVYGGGLIEGDLNLGDGDNTVFNESSEIVGDINTGTGDDLIGNDSGVIEAPDGMTISTGGGDDYIYNVEGSLIYSDILTGDGADNIFNENSTIGGNIGMGTGNDTLVSDSGLIAGGYDDLNEQYIPSDYIDLGEGDNYASFEDTDIHTNNITSGAGDDTLIGRDTDIYGSGETIDLGDGDNLIDFYYVDIFGHDVVTGAGQDTIYTYSSYIDGNVSTGGDDDRVELEDTDVTGSLALGEGDNYADIYSSYVGGGITAGSGDDTVMLSSGFYGGSFVGDGTTGVLLGGGNNYLSSFESTIYGDLTAGDGDDTVKLMDGSLVFSATGETVDLGNGDNYLLNDESSDINSDILAGSGDDTLLNYEESDINDGHYYYDNIIDLGDGNNLIRNESSDLFGSIYTGSGDDTLLNYEEGDINDDDDAYDNVIDLGEGDNFIRNDSSDLYGSIYTGSGDDTLLNYEEGDINSDDEAYGNVIDLGDGNNFIGNNSSDLYGNLYTGTGDDTLMNDDFSDLNDDYYAYGNVIDLGGGNNLIINNEYSDLYGNVSTGSGDDTILNTEGSEFNADTDAYENSINLGDGNNYVLNDMMSDMGSNLITGSGDDTFLNFGDFNEAAGDSTVALLHQFGAGDDYVLNNGYSFGGSVDMGTGNDTFINQTYKEGYGVGYGDFNADGAQTLMNTLDLGEGDNYFYNNSDSFYGSLGAGSGDDTVVNRGIAYSESFYTGLLGGDVSLGNGANLIDNTGGGNIGFVGYYEYTGPGGDVTVDVEYIKGDIVTGDGNDTVLNMPYYYNGYGYYGGSIYGDVNVGGGNNYILNYGGVIGEPDVAGFGSYDPVFDVFTYDYYTTGNITAGDGDDTLLNLSKMAYSEYSESITEAIIYGDVDLGDGDNYLYNYGGTIGFNGIDEITGDVTAGSGNDTLMNMTKIYDYSAYYAIIYGDVDLGDGDNYINNYGGRIYDDVIVGSGNDTVRNLTKMYYGYFFDNAQAYIGGDVSLGNGNNLLENYGAYIGGGVVAGDGDDTLLNVAKMGYFENFLVDYNILQSVIGDDVSLGGGNNYVFNYGSLIDGDVIAGDGDDTILNIAKMAAEDTMGNMDALSSYIEGDLDVGGGDNFIENYGSDIDGNVSAGDGADTLLNVAKMMATDSLGNMAVYESYIGGDVDLGNGANYLLNFGSDIDGGVITGDGDDIVYNEAKMLATDTNGNYATYGSYIGDDVSLGNGNNLLVNYASTIGAYVEGYYEGPGFADGPYGSVKGGVYAGDGDDSVFNEAKMFMYGGYGYLYDAHIVGDINLGDGDNYVYNNSQIGLFGVESLYNVDTLYNDVETVAYNSGKIITGSGNDTVINMGKGIEQDSASNYFVYATIAGGLDLGGGGDYVMNSGADIGDDVQLGTGSDTLINSKKYFYGDSYFYYYAFIYGDVDLGGGNDSLDGGDLLMQQGGAFIFGDVSTGYGDDTVINGVMMFDPYGDDMVDVLAYNSVIDGDVSLGNGNDFFHNQSKMLFDDYDGDTIANNHRSSVVSGNVHLGDGDDSLFNDGYIFGAVFGDDTPEGAGDDYIRNYGFIGRTDTVYSAAFMDTLYDVAVMTGGGDDTLINATPMVPYKYDGFYYEDNAYAPFGYIDGNVYLGGGSDVVHNGLGSVMAYDVLQETMVNVPAMGIIDGNVWLDNPGDSVSAGDDMLFNWGGSAIYGDVYAGYGDDYVYNGVIMKMTMPGQRGQFGDYYGVYQAIIDGDVSLGAGNDELRNRGFIDDVYAGSGDDYIYNGIKIGKDDSTAGNYLAYFAYIDDIYLGDGNDSVINFGEIEDITAGAGDDYIYNGYTLVQKDMMTPDAFNAYFGELDDVYLGAGNDTLINYGEVEDVYGDDGDDYVYGGYVVYDMGMMNVARAGYFDDIFLGNGNDTFIFHGYADNIDAGDGDDYVAHKTFVFMKDASTNYAYAGYGEAFIDGDVSLGAGNDIFLGYNHIFGDIYGEEGDDYIGFFKTAYDDDKDAMTPDAIFRPDVFGDVDLGDGNDSLWNLGDIFGDVDGGLGDDNVYNGMHNPTTMLGVMYGNIFGDVRLGGGNDYLLNAGAYAGTEETYTSRIFGDVFLDSNDANDGNDTLINYGQIFGDVWGFGGDDLVRNLNLATGPDSLSGSIFGDVYLGAGNDSFFNGNADGSKVGRLFGDLEAGDGDDYVFNSSGSYLYGDQFGGAGNDYFLLDGYNYGNVTELGAGDDTVVLLQEEAAPEIRLEGDDELENPATDGTNDTLILAGTGGTFNAMSMDPETLDILLGDFEHLVKNNVSVWNIQSTEGTFTSTVTVNDGILITGVPDGMPTAQDVIADLSAVTVNAPGTLMFMDDEQIGSLAGDGTVTIGADYRLITGTNGMSTLFTGVFQDNGLNPITKAIDGGARLVKIGAGEFHIDNRINPSIFPDDPTLADYNVDPADDQNVFTGGIRVAEGTLRLNSVVDVRDTGMLVNEDATLTGDSIIFGDVTFEAGIITPGNSIGTIDISGRLIQDASTTTNMEINGIRADRILVGEDAVIDGTLNVDVVDLDSIIFNQPVGTTNFILIEAEQNIADPSMFDGILGDGPDDMTMVDRFDVVNVTGFEDLLFVSASVAEDVDTDMDDRDEVALAVTRISFMEAGNTFNEDQIAMALDAALAAGVDQDEDFANVIRNVDTLPSFAAAAEAFTQMSGEFYASFIGVGHNTAHHFLKQVDDRVYDFRSLRLDDQGGSGKGWSIWVRPYAALNDMDDQDVEGGVVEGYDADTYGFAVGADAHLNENFLFGIAAGYSSADIDANQRLRTGDLDSWQIGAYVSGVINKIFVDASFAYSNLDGQAIRNIAFGSLNRTASSDLEGEDIRFKGRVGVDLGTGGNTMFRPYLGLDFSDVSYDPFTETGADSLNLDFVDGIDHDAFYGSIGALVEWRHESSGGKLLIPSLHAAYRIDFTDDPRAVMHQFVGRSETLKELRGVQPNEGGFEFGAGLTGQVGRVNLFVDYQGLFRGEETEHLFGGGIRIPF